MNNQANYHTATPLACRLSVLIIVLAFAVSLAAHGAIAAHMGTDVQGGAAVTESSSALSSNGCEESGTTDDRGLEQSCYAVCVGSATIMVKGTLTNPIAPSTSALPSAQFALGQITAPDHSPPRLLS